MELTPEITYAWKNSPEYTVLDIAFLATYQEPISFNDFRINPDPLCSNYLKKIKKILVDDSPEFKAYVLEPRDGNQEKRFCTKSLTRDGAINLLNKVAGTPNFLTEQEEHQLIGQIDPNHPMISEEFKVAMEAWQAVLAHNPPKPKKGSRKTLIIKWLDKNHSELTHSAKERIAVLLNPNPEGGVSSSD